MAFLAQVNEAIRRLGQLASITVSEIAGGSHAPDSKHYAGRAFDLYERYPNTLRLSTWYQLERADGRLPAIVDSNNAKLAKIEEAQRAGLLTTAYSALELLTEVRALSMSWHLHTPELALVRRPSRARRREVVVESVRRLVGSD